LPAVARSTVEAFGYMCFTEVEKKKRMYIVSASVWRDVFKALYIRIYVYVSICIRTGGVQNAPPRP